jgi:hypothetical protein
MRKMSQPVSPVLTSSQFLYLLENTASPINIDELEDGLDFFHDGVTLDEVQFHNDGISDSQLVRAAEECELPPNDITDLEQSFNG